MELPERMARLEGEMAAVEARTEARQAEYRTDIARLAEDLAKRETGRQAEYRTGIARLAEDMAKRDTEAAKRETRLLLAVAGMVSLAVIVLGLLMRLP